MLVELRVRDLGVIDDLSLVLGPGMTALTGETGAGKTLVVEAIELLLGGRADPVLVRPGADEALVEGRFLTALDGSHAVDAGDAEAGDAELILARAVPTSGRTRAYVAGRMASLGALGEAGATLVELHGQHSHQTLLSSATQRAALDSAGGIDTGPVVAARRCVRQIDDALAALGGDTRGRARQLDLLTYQLKELDDAGLDDPDEDALLADEEARLANASAHRDAAAAAYRALADEDGAVDRVGLALSQLSNRAPLAALHDRLRALGAELTDAAGAARDMAESLEDDPVRLAEVTGRRQLLHALRRKYGDTLAEAIAERERIRTEIDDIEAADARAGALDEERKGAAVALAAAERTLGAQRRAAAPAFAAAVETQLRILAMPRARFEVAVGDDPAGESVTWLLAANPGEPPLPLTKVASGGELARTMLAVRLVLSDAPVHARTGGRGTGPPARTLVFDEVDAGIGGEAALAVGRALAALSHEHQVLVVTHLPQVAAFADHQISVAKATVGDRTVARVRPVAAGDRVVELSRMLSGQPGSLTARRHAEELLATAATERGRNR